MLLKNIQEWIYLLLIFAFIALLGNWMGFSIMPLKALPGMIILIIIALLGFILAKVIPLNIPSVIYISIIGVVVSLPFLPWTNQLVEWTEEVQLVTVGTPILAYAGISIGRSWTDFKKLGWRTLVVVIVVLLGTFVGSALIAEIILRMQGAI